MGSIISQLNFPPYSAACGKLLTQQLLKPGGVRGLCSSVLGEGATGEGLYQPDFSLQFSLGS